VYAANNPIRWTDPTGLSMFMSLEDFEIFEQEVQYIFGGEVIFDTRDATWGLRDEFVGIDVYGVRLANGESIGGSETGRALLSIIINSDRRFRLIFTGASGSSDYWARTIRVANGSTYPDGTVRNIAALLIHETAHAFTYYKGYLGIIRGSFPHLERIFDEAAAMTIENRFRYEMGLDLIPARYFIGGEAQHGFWPWMEGGQPNTLLRMREYGFTALQTTFIWRSVQMHAGM